MLHVYGICTYIRLKSMGKCTQNIPVPCSSLFWHPSSSQPKKKQSHVAALATQKSSKIQGADRDSIEKIPNKPKHGGRNSPVLFHHHRLEELRHDLWFHLGGVLNGAAGGGGKCSVTKSLWCTKHLHLFKDSQKYENWRIMFSFKCQNQSDHGYVFQKRKVG